MLRPVGRWPAGRAGLTAHAFQDVLGLEFCVVGSRVFHEEWVSDFAWWCLGVLARGWGEWFCEGFGFSRVVLAGAWVWLGLECDGGLGTMVAWVRREKKSPGTTSEERLCAEAPVRCRSCTSQPAISDVVTRDGPELYNRGDRSSMTAFGALLVVKLHSPVSLAWVSPALDLQNSLPSRIGYSRNMVINGIRTKTRWYGAACALMRPLYPLWKMLFPNYVTTTEYVGRAMLSVTKRRFPKPVLENRDINRMCG